MRVSLTRKKFDERKIKKRCLLNWVNMELKKYGQAVGTLDANPMFAALRTIANQIVDVKPEDSDKSAVMGVLTDFYGYQFIEPLKREGARSSWNEHHLIAQVVALLMNFVLTCDDHQTVHVRMVMENMHENDQMDIMRICKALGAERSQDKFEISKNWADVLTEYEGTNQLPSVDSLCKNKRMCRSDYSEEMSGQSFQSDCSRLLNLSSFNQSKDRDSWRYKLDIHLQRRIEECNRLKAALRNRQDDIDSANLEICNLKESVRASEKALRNLKISNATLLETLKDSKALREELVKENINALAEVASCKKEIERLKRENSNSRNSLEKLQTQRPKLIVKQGKRIQQKRRLLVKTHKEMEQNNFILEVELSCIAAEMGDIFKSMMAELGSSFHEFNNCLDANTDLKMRCERLEGEKNATALFKRHASEMLLILQRAATLLASTLSNAERALDDCQRLSELAKALQKRKKLQKDERWEADENEPQGKEERQDQSQELQLPGPETWAFERECEEPQSKRTHVTSDVIAYAIEGFPSEHGFNYCHTGYVKETRSSQNISCVEQTSFIRSEEDKEMTLNNSENDQTSHKQESSCMLSTETKSNLQEANYEQAKAKKRKTGVKTVLKRIKHFLNRSKKSRGREEHHNEIQNSQIDLPLSTKTFDVNGETFVDQLKISHSLEGIENFYNYLCHGPNASSTPKKRSPVELTKKPAC
uniref:HOOK N-terminal domain-containing protein n=1 Tax=Trichuris muris TaxID=70415 RepID=A0A5S6QK58_TRIMR